jgi:dipicolinate synthase subunit B
LQNFCRISKRLQTAATSFIPCFRSQWQTPIPDSTLRRISAKISLLFAEREPVTTIAGAEPFGPANPMDIMMIAPCTGNTLAKLNHAITDTPVLMAAKAHLRNGKPLLIAVSTNDGLSNNAKNLGELLHKKNIYFVPFSQDNYIDKTNSLVAHYELLEEAADAALQHRQLQPVIKERL